MGGRKIKILRNLCYNIQFLISFGIGIPEEVNDNILRRLYFRELSPPASTNPKGKKTKRKKVALDPAVMKKQETRKVVNPLFEKRLKNFDIGQDFQLKRDLTHFVRWPCYILLQWRRAIVYKCLKVPPKLVELSSSIRAWITKQLPNCLRWPTNTVQRQKREETEIVGQG